MINTPYTRTNNINKLTDDEISEFIDSDNLDSPTQDSSKYNNQKSIQTPPTESSWTRPNESQPLPVNESIPIPNHTSPPPLHDPSSLSPTNDKNSSENNPPPAHFPSDPIPKNAKFLPQWVHHDSKVTIKLPKLHTLFLVVILLFTVFSLSLPTTVISTGIEASGFNRRLPNERKAICSKIPKNFSHQIPNFSKM